MVDPPPPDERRTGPASLVTEDVTPELLLCTALVRSGLVDGAGASLVLAPRDRIGLAATDEAFVRVAEMQFSRWEGPGPEVIDSGRAVVVDDLHAQAARWPLTTPHAVTTPVRALATLPLSTTLGDVGLFAAYRTGPRPFTATDLVRLEAAATTVGALVEVRFDEAGLTLHAQAPTLPVAVGMVMARHGVDHDDALALLRARAFALSVSVPDLARDLAGGTVSLTELLDQPSDTR